MVSISFEHELDYLRDSLTGNPFPGLWIVVRNVAGNREIEVQAHVDSGTERSLLDGQIARALGLDLSTGNIQLFRSATGAELVSRLHRVVLAHDSLGVNELMIAFSETRLTRNLLGRDFFNLFQIGFRERRSKILIAAEEK